MIPTFDYRRGLPELEPKVIEAVRRVLHSNQLILGPETSGFEQEFAAWLGARHCIAVTSGTAALHVALLALELPAGAEVLTTANTCMPTAAAIVASGCQPRFVDVDADTLMMDAQCVEASLGDRTACVIPVHLWGNAVDMGPLLEIAARHGLPVIEDCAQAAGTRYGDRSVGLWGDLGCFSFYPTKNLGAYGEGGAIVTNNDELADRCREIRAYGAADGLAVRPGLNARISEIQAAILRVKLPLLDRHNARRREIAAALRRTDRDLVPARRSDHARRPPCLSSVRRTLSPARRTESPSAAARRGDLDSLSRAVASHACIRKRRTAW